MTYYYLNTYDENKKRIQTVARTEDWDEAYRWIGVWCKTHDLKKFEGAWVSTKEQGKEVNWTPVFPRIPKCIRDR